MVSNDQLVRPIGKTLIEFEVADFQFQENFIVMIKKLTHLVLKMTCIPTIRALTLDLGHVILSPQKSDEPEDKIKKEPICQPETYQTKRYFKKQGDPVRTACCE